MTQTRDWQWARYGGGFNKHEEADLSTNECWGEGERIQRHPWASALEEGTRSIRVVMESPKGRSLVGRGLPAHRAEIVWHRAYLRHRAGGLGAWRWLLSKE